MLLDNATVNPVVHLLLSPAAGNAMLRFKSTAVGGLIVKKVLVIAALSLSCATPSLAFDEATAAIVAHHKAGKPINITDVAQLMRSSERWCYNQDGTTCDWSDVYLNVTDAGADYEISNAWNETYDIAFVDKGVFEDNRSICETGFDWVPSVRASLRADGSVVSGRALATLKADIAAEIADGDSARNCFDYLWQGADAAAQTITLLQRQYVDGAYDASRDTPVTLHFDPTSAAALTWRW